MQNFLLSVRTIPFFGILALIINISLFSCGKEKLNNENNLNQESVNNIEGEASGIVTQEYVYQGVSYFLEFDASDEDAGAFETPSLLAINEAIGDNEYYSVLTGDGKITLYDSEEASFDALGYDNEMIETIKSIERGEMVGKEPSVQTRAPLMDYFEHSDMNGLRLDGDAVSGIACKGDNCCSRVFYQSNLSTVPKNGGGTWNNNISSMDVDGSSLVTSTSDELSIAFYRESGFPTGRCDRIIINLMTFPGFSFTHNRIRQVRWCRFGKSLNDRITGWTLVHCRAECNDCWNNAFK